MLFFPPLFFCDWFFCSVDFLRKHHFSCLGSETCAATGACLFSFILLGVSLYTRNPQKAQIGFVRARARGRAEPLGRCGERRGPAPALYRALAPKKVLEGRNEATSSSFHVNCDGEKLEAVKLSPNVQEFEQDLGSTGSVSRCPRRASRVLAR